MATKKNSDKPQGRKAKLEAKLADKVGSDIVDTLNSASADELREKLSSLAKHEDETEEALEKDEEIERLTEELKQMKAPYKDTLSGIKLQRSFIAILMRERGRQAKLAPVQAQN
jgi:hypothetical protein